MNKSRAKKGKTSASPRRARPGPPSSSPSCSPDSPDPNPVASSNVITLLSDFGLADTYVGTMKGVIASINPHAKVIDLCHEVAPQDIRGAAFLLAGAFEYFPASTVHLAVVDPTVGSERRAICVRSAGHYFIGPDNGLLSLASYAAGRPKIHLLENDEYFLPRRSSTFHGRDVFAPAAAHLAAGAAMEELGRPVRTMKRIRAAGAVVHPGRGISGRVVHVDGFGNLVTNIGPDDIRRAYPRTRPERLFITCGEHAIRGLSEIYCDVSPGEAVALIGSFGLMEIAVRDADAAAALGVGRGGRIEIRTMRRTD
jgi:hypothetical protein